MGYFSNGTEGAMYQEQFCNSCVHDIDQNCPVWLAHLLANGDTSLDLFIPRDERGFNQKCKMFIDKSSGDAV